MCRKLRSFSVAGRGAVALLPTSEGGGWGGGKEEGGRREEGGSKKKKKKRQKEIRNEEKIGKRAIREGKQ